MLLVSKRSDRRVAADRGFVERCSTAMIAPGPGCWLGGKPA